MQEQDFDVQTQSKMIYLLSPIYLIILLDFFFLLPRFVQKFKKSLSEKWDKLFINFGLALINYDTLMIYFVHKSLKHFCEFSSFHFEKLLFN